MELRTAGLKEQPFRTHGRPVVFVNYGAQHRAFDFINTTYEHNKGLGLFQGPVLSGKTTLLTQFAAKHQEHCSVAMVDGVGATTKAFLGRLLREFGYEFDFDTVNEQISMLKVFVQQQTVAGKPPLLIVENAHEMNPSALRVLCELAEVRIRERYALRILLCSDRPLDYLIAAPVLETLSKRLTGDFHLDALTMNETCDYLYAKMRHGGCLDPQNVFPESVCDELHHASGGWPGVVDRLALLALAKADSCPVKTDHIERPRVAESTRKTNLAAAVNNDRGLNVPLVCLTHRGETVQEIPFNGTRLLIGRSRHNDLHIDSKFISRHHALMIRNDAATLLMDLNSANGTFVNSRRVSNQLLMHEDVISIGEFGLKFLDRHSRSRQPLEGGSFDETIVMKSLDDMREMLARESTEMMPANEFRTGSDDESA